MEVELLDSMLLLLLLLLLLRLSEDFAEAVVEPSELEEAFLSAFSSSNSR